MYFSAFGKVAAASASACTRRPRLSSVQVSGSKCLPFYKNAHHRIGADANPGGPRLDGICKVYFQTRSDSGVPGRCKIWGDTTEPRMYTCMCSIIFSSHFGVSLQRYLTRFLSGFGSLFPGSRMRAVFVSLSKCRTFLCRGQGSRKPTRRCGCSA